MDSASDERTHGSQTELILTRLRGHGKPTEYNANMGAAIRRRVRTGFLAGIRETSRVCATALSCSLACGRIGFESSPSHTVPGGDAGALVEGATTSSSPRQVDGGAEPSIDLGPDGGRETDGVPFAGDGGATASGPAGGSDSDGGGPNDQGVSVAEDASCVVGGCDAASCSTVEAVLSELDLSFATLNPGFAPGTMAYTAQVSSPSIQLTAVASDSTCAVIRVNGVEVVSGEPSFAIPVPLGTTDVTISVTAGDGTTSSTYVVAVDRNFVLPTDFSGERNIVFDTTPNGADVPTDVNDVPVLIRITDASVLDAVQPGAADLRFLSSDGGTWLDYEIERWDPAGDGAEVWVLVPLVRGNTRAEYMTMYYDDVVDGLIPHAQCSHCVFGVAGGYYGAWHMAGEPSTGSASVRDSSVNAHHGSPFGMDGSNLVDGIVGKGIHFDGSSEYVDVALSAAGEIPNESAYTIAAWMNADISSENVVSLVDFSG